MAWWVRACSKLPLNQCVSVQFKNISKAYDFKESFIKIYDPPRGTDMHTYFRENLSLVIRCVTSFIQTALWFPSLGMMNSESLLMWVGGIVWFIQALFSAQQKIKKKNFQIWIQDLKNASCLNTVPYCDKYSYWNFKNLFTKLYFNIHSRTFFGMLSGKQRTILL